MIASFLSDFSARALRPVIGIFSILVLVGCGGDGGSIEPVNPFQNTLTTIVSGNGEITANIGIAGCTSSCETQLDQGTQVELSAVAQTGYRFQGWEGACSGTSACAVILDQDRSVTAVFVEIQQQQNYRLDVSISGQGSVMSTPGGIDCGADCNQTYTEGATIMLVATPVAGFNFDRWSGDCSGSGSCSVTMDQDRTVSAIFVDGSGQADVLISDYRPQNDAFQLGQIPNNASGITWHESIQQYLIVRNGSGRIYRYDENFAYLGEFQITSINQDTEGLGFVGSNEVMVVTEGNFAHKLVVEEFSGTIDGSPDQTQAYRLLPQPPSNKGLEGVAVRKAENGQPARVYACQEGTGSNSNADMRVVYFDVPTPDPFVLLSYDDNLTVVEPFDAEVAFAGVATDIAGMTYDERTGHLIIVSQESRKAIQVDPETGQVISQLSLSGAPQFEGVTIGPNNELVFVSEGNWIRIYTLP